MGLNFKRKTFELLLLLLACVTIHAEQTSTLQLNEVYNISLSANEHGKYSVYIQKAPEKAENLFLEAITPFNDPFEEPYMTVTSTDNYKRVCNDEEASFTGICEILNEELKEGRVFTVDVYCLVDCQMSLSAYLSATFSLTIGKKIELSAMEGFAIGRYLELEIPEGVDYTSILILTELTTFENATQGLEMLLNYGPDPKLPTMIDYMQKGQSTYGHMMSAQVERSAVKPGEKILIFLLIGMNNTIDITTFLINGDEKMLSIGTPIVDFTSKSENRKYTLDLSNFLSGSASVKEEDILIKFIVYSGSPDLSVSFDSNFTNVINQNNWLIESAMAYLITPTLRLEKGFKDKIYMQVESYFSSSYYLEIIVNKKNFDVLENQIMHLIMLSPGDLQNIIYEDETYFDEVPKGGLIKFKLTVEMLSGSVVVGIRDCDSLMSNNNIEGCLIKTIENLSDPSIEKSFDNIEGTFEKYYNTYVLNFYYNVSTCPKVSANTTFERHICDFHIIIANRKHEPPGINADVHMGVEIVKFNERKILKEGILVRDNVHKESSNFYEFELQSVENITRLEFFTTVIQGDIAMLMSRTEEFPDLNDENLTVDKYKYTLQRVLTIEGAELTKGKYYLSTFGYEVSDYTIGVAIERVKQNQGTNTTNTEVSEIRLIKGISQSYEMPSTKSIMKFIIQASENENIELSIDNVMGKIDYTLETKASTPKVICTSYSISFDSGEYCEFATEKGVTYLLTVKGELGSTEIFTISYSSSGVCEEYPIDYPLTLDLKNVQEDGDSECFLFSIYKYEDIQVTVILSEINKLKVKDRLKILLQFGESGKEIEIVGHEKMIKKKELETLCSESNNTNKNNSLNGHKESGRCDFTLKINLNPKQEGGENLDGVQLEIVVRSDDNENVLYDGISQKIMTEQLSTTKPKKFCYFIYETQANYDLTIFLSTLTKSKYQVSTKVIGNQEFYKDYVGALYPPFDPNMTEGQTVNSTEYSSITVLNIGSGNFKKAGKEGLVVLISVFGIPYLEGEETFVFNIEATQSSTSLPYGDSKIGYIDKDEIYSFSIFLQANTPSLVSVRSLGLDKCLKTYVETREFVSNSDSDSLSGSLQNVLMDFKDVVSFTTEKGDKKIVIKGTGPETCTYQITYNALNNPLISVLRGIPYEIKILESGASKYFLYLHQSNESFHIIQMINAGNSTVYVQNINSSLEITSQIQSLFTKNIDTLNWKGDLNANLVIDTQSPNFCFQCYYLIVIKGKQTVNTEMIVNLQSLPIPLKEGSISSDKLKKAQSMSYQFYSVSSFNVTVNLIYGSVSIFIITPNGQNITRSGIKSQIEIVVPQTKENNTEGIDYFDETSRYTIMVTADQESSFYVGIKKNKATMKIYEGKPITLTLTSGTPLIVQFSCLETSNNISLFVEDLQYKEMQSSSSKINFKVSKISNGTASAVNVVKSHISSEGSHNLELNPSVADYFIELSTDQSTEVSIVVAKLSFTHLIAKRNIIVRQPSVFEIYSPGDSIMVEVYSCKADIDIVAGTNFTKIQNEEEEGIVRMEHGNYGGHYVISSENLSGEYFLKTNSSNNEEIMYLIAYSLYSPQNGEKMPYRILGIQNLNIQYSYKLGVVQFRLNRIYRKDGGMLLANSKYVLYVSNSSESITEMSKCSIGKVYLKSEIKINETITAASIQDYIVFELKTSEIEDIIGSSDRYYVGGEALLSWENTIPTHASSVNFIYGITQMLKSNQPKFNEINKNTNFVVIWIVLPFILGFAALFFAGRYFIRSFRYRPTEFMEDDEFASDSDGFGHKVANSTSNKNGEKGDSRD